MARFEAAEKRMFENIWICMKCNTKHRTQPGKKPEKCRSCGKKKFRAKSKVKKA
jgi:ribosomal protein L40E